MAILRSEDKKFQSSITITPGKILEFDAVSALTKEKEHQIWQLVDLQIVSGKRSLSFTTEANQGEVTGTDVSLGPDPSLLTGQSSVHNSVQSISAIAHAYLLCREPHNETATLIKMMDEMITGSRSKLLFEPAEPSFELSINSIGGGLRVEFFVDAGNVETGIYRWDSLGVRFFTTNDNLQSFIGELKSEFNC